MGGALISVVIPARNRAAVINRAVAGVAAQTLPVHEIIIIDDGSTDPTVAAVQAMAREDRRIRLIALPERVGAARARNLGAAEARGDLIAFLDSDDRWHPTKLERQSALLAHNPEAPAAFTGISYRYLDRRPFTRTPPSMVDAELLYQGNVLGTCSTALVRRDDFAAVGGFEPDLPSCQDWDLWLRLADRGPLLAVPEPLTEYFFDERASISSDAMAVIRGHERVHARIYARVPDPMRRRMLRAEHQRGLASRLSRRTFAPRAALASAFDAMLTQPGLRGLRTLAETAVRILIHPIRHPARRPAPSAPPPDAARAARDLGPEPVRAPRS